MYRYLKSTASVDSGNYIYFWKSKGLSDEKIDSITESNYINTPELSHYGAKVRVKFIGSCLKQDKATHNHGTIVNIYIVYEICKNYNISSYPTLENCLFGAVNLTENDDFDQYKYSGYGMDLIGKDSFHLGMDLVEMQLYLVLIRLILHMLTTKQIKFLSLAKILHKELMVQHFMQKNCIQLILLKIIKIFV